MVAILRWTARTIGIFSMEPQPPQPIRTIAFMGNICQVMLTSMALFGEAAGQQAADKQPSSAIRELLALKSSDGRSHQIYAIALGRSGNTDVLYCVESESDLPPGVDGEYFLWKLDLTGKVLHKGQIEKDMPDRGVFPPVAIVPLPGPQEGAIVIGRFETPW